MLDELKRCFALDVVHASRITVKMLSGLIFFVIEEIKQYIVLFVVFFECQFFLCRFGDGNGADGKLYV